MKESFDVTPKTTEQNLIVCGGKSEDRVINNKRYWYQGIVLMKLPTDRQEASNGLSATAEFLVFLSLC